MSDRLESCAGPVGIRHGRQLKKRIIQARIVRERQPGRVATMIVHTVSASPSHYSQPLLRMKFSIS